VDSFHRINEFDYPAAGVLQCLMAQSYSNGLRVENLDGFELRKPGLFGSVRVSARSNLAFSPIPPERRCAQELARDGILLAVREVLQNIFS
jgi:hypothetical protein